MKRFKFVSLLVILLTAIGLTIAWAGLQSPPTQPEFGPGGSDYINSEVITNGPYYAEGPGNIDNYKYFIYEPSSPMPSQAPVVLFLHGWLAYKPEVYQAWMNHLVKKGNIVVWAQYDAGLTLPRSFANKAIRTWRSALEKIDTWSEEGHVAPVKENGKICTALVGHSIGGYLSAIIASKTTSPIYQLPVPKAIVMIEPGGLDYLPGSDFSAIAPESKLLVVVGDEDSTVCKSTALHVWNECPQIPEENRDFLLANTDKYGFPYLVADHKFPATDGFRAKIDARDFFITYKLTVAALNCAFAGTDCEYAFSNGGMQQIDMGQWSDGTPVNKMTWVENPNLLETACTDP